MNSMTDPLLEMAWTQFWQIAVVVLLAIVFSLSVGKHRVHLSYLMWMLVLVKALTPPIWNSPTSLFFWSTTPEVVATSSETQIDVAAVPAPPVQEFAKPAASLDDSPTTQTELTAVNWKTLLVFVWVAGMILMLVIQGVQYFRIIRRLRHTSEDADSELNKRIATIVQQIGLKRVPTLWVTSSFCGPAVFGFLKPTIVLPQSTANDRSTDILDPILTHELIHLRRRDPWYALLQLAAVTAWWWNPLVWYASRAATAERERCCDEEVLGTLDCSACNYAQCLLDNLAAQSRQSQIPGTLMLTSGTINQRRLEHIMVNNHRFVSRPPRWLWLVAIVFGLLLLPVGSAVQSGQQAATEQTDEKTLQTESEAVPLGLHDPEKPVTTPKLLYLGWQKDGVHSTGMSIPSTLWNPDGKILSQAKSDEILKKVKSFDVYWRQEDDLNPLSMVFQVDGRLRDSPVMPTVITADGVRHSSAATVNTPRYGLIVSAAAPYESSLSKWPEEISLEIKYPIENRVIIKTLKEIPDEPVKIAKGVSWYLDPKRAMETDPGTGRMQMAYDKTAAVLQINRETADKLTQFECRVYLRDQKKPLRGHYSTIIESDGQQNEIRVSDSFGQKQDIEKVEILRQRYKTSLIKNIPLKLQLLPEVNEK